MRSLTPCFAGQRISVKPHVCSLSHKNQYTTLHLYFFNLQLKYPIVSIRHPSSPISQLTTKFFSWADTTTQLSCSQTNSIVAVAAANAKAWARFNAGLVGDSTRRSSLVARFFAWCRRSSSSAGESPSAGATIPPGRTITMLRRFLFGFIGAYWGIHLSKMDSWMAKKHQTDFLTWQSVRFRLIVFSARLLLSRERSYPSHQYYRQRRHKQFHQLHDQDLSTKPINDQETTTTPTHPPNPPTSSPGFAIIAPICSLFHTLLAIK